MLFAIIPRAMPWARSFWAFSPFLNRMLNLSQLIVENSVTSIALFKYFFMLLQPLHSANAAILFCQRSHFIQPTKLTLPPSEVESITQRSRIFNPAQSYLYPSAVVSVDSMKRMNLRNDVHDAKEAHLMITRMLLKLRPDVSVTTSGRIFCCVGT